MDFFDITSVCYLMFSKIDIYCSTNKKIKIVSVKKKTTSQYTIYTYIYYYKMDIPKFKIDIIDTHDISNQLLAANSNNIFIPKTTANNNNSNSIQRTTLGVNIKNIYLQPLLLDSIYDAEIKDKDRLTADDRKAKKIERQQLKYDILNDGQKAIFDYFIKNKTKIITIQAGPGCGKSFLLRTLAHCMPDTRTHTIIYKHDLLYSFRLCTTRHTVTQFMMQALNIRYYTYRAFDREMSANISALEFMLAIIAIIRKSCLGNLNSSVVFLDEYTVVSKPTLLVLLMLLEHHEIGTIICGDKDQLQNIHNSRHAILSSHSIATSFSVREFNLSKNERCTDIPYNKIINYFAQFSSNCPLDNYAYAHIAAIFMRQIIELPRYDQIHLAATHQELSDLAHVLVCNNANYYSDFYTIDQSKLKNDANASLIHTCATQAYEQKRKNSSSSTPHVGKFLPYLPLVIGGRYYVGEHSELTQGTLMEYDQKNQTVSVLMDASNELCVLTRTKADDVIFNEHLDYLLTDHDGNRIPGSIYAFPLYPANFMSIHKCQGCTIRDNLDLILHKTTYQGLYVALSRVTTPTQINRVTIPNQISHLVSTIVNFPEHCHMKQLPIEIIEERMINYKFYEVKDLAKYAQYCCDFILADDPTIKQQHRQKIIERLCYDASESILRPNSVKTKKDNNLITINRIIKYRDIFRALACLDIIDYNVWLHEFILTNPDMSLFLPNKNGEALNTLKMSDMKQFPDNALKKLADWDLSYSLDIATPEYIRRYAKLNSHIDPSDVEKNRMYIIENPNPFMYLETSKFCCKVYHKYKRDESITLDWLIDELNLMLDDKKCQLIGTTNNQCLNNSVDITNIQLQSVLKKHNDGENNNNDDDDDDNDNKIDVSNIFRSKRRRINKRVTENSDDGTNNHNIAKADGDIV